MVEPPGFEAEANFPPYPDHDQHLLCIGDTLTPPCGFLAALCFQLLAALPYLSGVLQEVQAEPRTY